MIIMNACIYDSFGRGVCVYNNFKTIADICLVHTVKKNLDKFAR